MTVILRAKHFLEAGSRVKSTEMVMKQRPGCAHQHVLPAKRTISCIPPSLGSQVPLVVRSPKQTDLLFIIGQQVYCKDGAHGFMDKNYDGCGSHLSYSEEQELDIEKHYSFRNIVRASLQQ